MKTLVTKIVEQIVLSEASRTAKLDSEAIHYILLPARAINRLQLEVVGRLLGQAKVGVLIQHQYSTQLGQAIILNDKEDKLDHRITPEFVKGLGLDWTEFMTLCYPELSMEKVSNAVFSLDFELKANDNATMTDSEVRADLGYEVKKVVGEKLRFPRRMCVEKMVPAEYLITEAVAAVEKIGADVKLTDAVILLGKAKGLVSDYVDAQAEKELSPELQTERYEFKPIAPLLHLDKEEERDAEPQAPADHTNDKVPTIIQLNKAEIQSQYNRVKWAEGLILQLPSNHDGRNSWLLNYGTDNEAKVLRDDRGIKWDSLTESAELVGDKLTPIAIVRKKETEGSQPDLPQVVSGRDFAELLWILASGVEESERGVFLNMRSKYMRK